MYFTTIFHARLFPHLKLKIAHMKQNTLTKHKNVSLIYEKNEPKGYNVFFEQGVPIIV